MPRDEGTVTEVGVGNIQFYVPNAVSSHDECPFDPGDAFEVRTLAGVGLLFLDPDAQPTLADLVDVLELNAGADADLAADHLTTTQD